MPNAITIRTVPLRVAQALGTSLVIALGSDCVAAPAAVKIVGQAVQFPEHVVLITRIAPPAPIIEPEPRKRKGFEWSPGFWKYDGVDYRWIPGQQVAQRPGMRWKSPGWKRDGDKWYFAVGHWEKVA